MTRLIPSLVLSAALATGVAAFVQTDVSGDWTLTINGPQGTIDTEASFKQDGEKVTGTLTSPMGQTDVAGSLSGSTLSLAFNVVTQNGPIDIKVTAEISGPEMKGVMDFGMGTADFTGKKK